MLKKNEAGFTVVELLVLVSSVSVVCLLTGYVVYVAVHFINKIW